MTDLQTQLATLLGQASPYPSLPELVATAEGRLTNANWSTYRDIICRLLNCAWYQSAAILKEASTEVRATASVQFLNQCKLKQ